MCIAKYNQSKCQNIGSVGEALGGISTLQSDPFSIFNNPGLLDKQKSDLGVNVLIPYGIYELQKSSFAIRNNFSFGGIGLGLHRFEAAGMEAQDLIIGLGKSINSISFGSSLQIRQVNILENGRHVSLMFNLGAVSSVLPGIDFGISVSNLNQSKIGENLNEVHDSRIRLATKIEASSKTYFYFEADKQLYLNPIYRIGLEYQLAESVILYTGVENQPIEPATGFSIKWRKWNFDSSISLDQRLGLSQSFSIRYCIKNDV